MQDGKVLPPPLPPLPPLAGGSTPVTMLARSTFVNAGSSFTTVCVSTVLAAPRAMAFGGTAAPLPITTAFQSRGRSGMAY
jgi:hypothetical protein